jgi:hypothetical protein
MKLLLYFELGFNVFISLQIYQLPGATSYLALQSDAKFSRIIPLTFSINLVSGLYQGN